MGGRCLGIVALDVNVRGFRMQFSGSVKIASHLASDADLDLLKDKRLLGDSNVVARTVLI
ncbi:hypothetical protein [Bradyrhizobium sp. USDA 4504]